MFFIFIEVYFMQCDLGPFVKNLDHLLLFVNSILFQDQLYLTNIKICNTSNPFYKKVLGWQQSIFLITIEEKYNFVNYASLLLDVTYKCVCRCLYMVYVRCRDATGQIDAICTSRNRDSGSVALRLAAINGYTHSRM